MSEDVVLTRKSIGIIFIIVGTALGIVAGIQVYTSKNVVYGLPALLPANETAFFATFPGSSDKFITKYLTDIFKIDWQKNVVPLVSNTAFVLLKPESSASAEKLFPVLLANVKSTEDAFAFISTYQNPQRDIREFIIEGIKAYSSPSFTFAFVDDVLIIAPAAQSVGRILRVHAGLIPNLGRARTFAKLRRTVEGDYFVFLKPPDLPKKGYHFLTSKLPIAPHFIQSYEAIAIGIQPQGESWNGTSLAIRSNSIVSLPEHSYHGRLPYFFPADFDVFISGQDLGGQLRKFNFASDTSMPIHIQFLLKSLSDEYLPGIDIEKELLPLLVGEFGVILRGSVFLFITEVIDIQAQQRINVLWHALYSAGGIFTPSVRDVVLPDGTKAHELVPDRSKVRAHKELFENNAIHGIQFGSDKALYYALAQDKLFFTNDITLLKKSLLLTKEPGQSLRDSSAYRRVLQPILKNPELLGTFTSRDITFGFSKRTFFDYVETRFRFVLQ